MKWCADMTARLSFSAALRVSKASPVICFEIFRLGARNLKDIGVDTCCVNIERPHQFEPFPSATGQVQDWLPIRAADRRLDVRLIFSKPGQNFLTTATKPVF